MEERQVRLFATKSLGLQTGLYLFGGLPNPSDLNNDLSLQPPWAASTGMLPSTVKSFHSVLTVYALSANYIVSNNGVQTERDAGQQETLGKGTKEEIVWIQCISRTNHKDNRPSSDLLSSAQFWTTFGYSSSQGKVDWAWH